MQLYTYHPLTGEFMNSRGTVLSHGTHKLANGMSKDKYLSWLINPEVNPKVTTVRGKPCPLEATYVFPNYESITVTAGLGIANASHPLYNNPLGVEKDPVVREANDGFKLCTQMGGPFIKSHGKAYSRASVIVAKHLGYRTSMPLFAYKIPNTPPDDYSLKYLFYIWFKGQFVRNNMRLKESPLHLQNPFGDIDFMRYDFIPDRTYNAKAVSELSEWQREHAKKVMFVRAAFKPFLF